MDGIQRAQNNEQNVESIHNEENVDQKDPSHYCAGLNHAFVFFADGEEQAPPQCSEGAEERHILKALQRLVGIGLAVGIESPEHNHSHLRQYNLRHRTIGLRPDDANDNDEAAKQHHPFPPEIPLGVTRVQESVPKEVTVVTQPGSATDEPAKAIGDRIFPGNLSKRHET